MNGRNTNKLNGSVDLLAQAMRKVFKEATQEAVEPVIDLIADSEKRLENKIDSAVEATNKNVQAELSQHRKDVAADVKKIVSQK